jgi:hypothetical protein
LKPPALIGRGFRFAPATLSKYANWFDPVILFRAFASQWAAKPRQT